MMFSKFMTKEIFYTLGLADYIFYCKTKQINMFYDMNHYAGLVHVSNVVNHILIGKHYIAAKFGEYKLT